MNAMNQFRVITHTFHKSMRNLTAGALALGLGLFVVTSDVHAFNWTNLTGGTFNDPNSWSPTPGGPGGPADTANFALTNTIVTSLTSDFGGLGTLTFGSGNSTVNGNVTINLNGHTLGVLSGTSGSASGFVVGQQGGSTAIVTFAGGTIFCTNNSLGGRLTVGRNGPGFLFVNNTIVNAGAIVIANGAAENNSKLVLSGAGTYWSNSSTVAVGNNAGAFGCSLVISNSASLTTLSTFSVAGVAGSGSNSFLLDSNARLFTKLQNATIGVGSTNDIATVQGGAVWDVGGRYLLVGPASGALSNVLRVGNSPGDTAAISNCTSVVVGSNLGNQLDLRGGQIVAAVTNSSIFSGFGTVVSNVFMAGSGTLTPGNGNTVGALTMSSNLTLVSTSTTIMKLDKGQAGSNDLITVTGTATEAGTLTINNVGAALVGGDTFKLFALGTTSGNFAVTNLPPLNSPLVWNTSQLGSSGIISVVLPSNIVGPDPQAVLVGSNVVISTVVTGVPAPSVQWQYNGANLTDGATTNGGSSISGSLTSTLTINNAQLGDAGQYCLIASNIGGSITNCMTLEVTTNTAPPLIGGPTDQNVISPNNATFTAVAVGIPTPTVQWLDNGTPILNETNTTLVIPGVTFSLDGHQYCIAASNIAGTATNCAILHVVVPPLIQTQPVSLVVTQTQSATFTVVSTNGVPAATFQWSFNNQPISGATNTSYTIASATPANDGSYKVVAANVIGSATSSNATLTVNSVMSAALTPTNNASGVCYDTPLYMLFDRPVFEKFVGKISIYDSTNNVTPVDVIDTGAGLIQSRVIGTETFNTYPVIITNNLVAIYPHLGVLSSNQTYYVTVDAGTFADASNAFFAGITSTTAWQFTTKPTGPANPNNVVVAADGSGDFCTVQGAVDSLPVNNITPTLVNIRNGTYTEVVDTRNKNNITFRGQSRTGAIVGYANNNNINGSTHSRMAFKVFSSDVVIDNMTIVNTTPQGGSQAEALMLDTSTARFILNNAEVDSRQDTILANVNSDQGYFYNSLIQGNFDYIWGGGNLFITNCQFNTIGGASSFNLAAPRTDNGPTGPWQGPDGNFSSNGFSFVNCLLTRTSSSTVSNISMSDGNGNPDGLAAWINCRIDVAGGNGYVTPLAGVLTTQILWEYQNSNLTSTAAAPLGLTVLTNGDARLACASSATCWLNGWVPQLAVNIITNPVGATVSAGSPVSFSVVATGIPDPNDYVWLKNGNPITHGNVVSGPHGSTLTIPSTVGDDNGTYSVVVGNGVGSATSAGAILVVTGTAPVASFTATPNSGPEPLSVTFQDTSSGSPLISLSWDFGDGNTATGVGGSSVVHPYAAGTYTVTLIASNYFGTSTLIQPNLIVSVNPVFEAWQLEYFGCTNCPAAAPGAITGGNGVNNNNEFLAGFDPTNPAAYPHIISIARSGADMNVTYLGANGDSSYAGGPVSRTNVLEFTTGAADGSYSNNFVSTGQTNILSGGTGVGVVTNMVDSGGAVGRTRYYRVRVLAP